MVGIIGVIANPGNGTIWRILLILRERRNDGRPKAFPAKTIAASLGLGRGQNAVSEAISAFRRKAIQILDEKGFASDEDAVVVSGKCGYELATHLSVVDSSGNPSAAGPEKEEATAATRRTWILDQLKKKRKLKRGDIEKEFKISTATAKRDIRELGNLIEFSGAGADGYYRSM
jgi:hypothetical protein